MLPFTLMTRDAACLGGRVIPFNGYNHIEWSEPGPDLVKSRSEAWACLGMCAIQVDAVYKILI